ncbi:MAG: hypothetical protein M2R45_00520 [Verrucomicrobia subdivision 3 bacterium]|nr:hypothetical protein [Limisphaerales bacterium]MCS1413602.1 hypothetical protein [Limisphaerales bacterium]
MGTFPEDDQIGLSELYVDGSWVYEVVVDLEEVSGPPDGSIFRVRGGSQGGEDPEEDGEEFPESNTFFGNLDEVRIYNRALEVSEIVELLINGLGELPAPEINGQPKNTDGILGRSATLSANASGLVLEYQWMKGDAAIEGRNHHQRHGNVDPPRILESSRWFGGLLGVRNLG